MCTVMYLLDPKYKLNYTCSPKDAVIAAYAQHKSKNSKGVWQGDFNTWDYKKKYDNLVEEGKHTYLCGDFSVFKDGRNF